MGTVRCNSAVVNYRVTLEPVDDKKPTVSAARSAIVTVSHNTMACLVDDTPDGMVVHITMLAKTPSAERKQLLGAALYNFERQGYLPKGAAQEHLSMLF